VRGHRSCISPISEFEQIEIRKALGRILAQDIVPAINVPAHDNSAMDGYAVRSADFSSGDLVLEEIGTALAGRPFAGKVGPGNACAS
jgi:molybdopterin molybdotransferase